MFTRRKHLGTAVYNGCLYAVGGRDDASELSSAEMYNPTTNAWSVCVAMNSRRSGVGLAVANGQLYAVGGFDGTTYLKTVEVYDRDSTMWRHAGNMNFRRLGGGVGVVRMAGAQLNTGFESQLRLSSATDTAAGTYHSAKFNDIT
jgi:kelch-like protein 20